jgi:hypothetical protein
MVHTEKKPQLLGSPMGRYMYPEQYLELLPTIEQSIAHLRERGIHEYGYSPESMLTIDRALAIARTHEMNEIESRRIRKFDREPYILHPLAMAQEAMRMRQHPTIVAACLMHDVPEDVKLNGLQSSEDWIKQIESAFVEYADRDRLMRILRAELKTESLGKLEDKDAVVDFYTNTSLGKTALSYLKQLRGNESIATHQDREHIAEVLYDLNRIMSDSYIADINGKKEFDPSILIVKILDTWQNLQTPGFWKTQLTSPDKDAKTIAKLIRARVLTNVAEFLGMRKVASEMTQAIAAIHDVNNVNFPLLKKLEVGENGEGNELNARLAQIGGRMQEAQNVIPGLKARLLDHTEDNIEVVLQMPWAAAQTDADDFTAPTGQLIYYIRSRNPEQAVELKVHQPSNYMIDTTPLEDAKAVRALVYRQIGRRVHDFGIRDLQGHMISRVRAEEPAARYISTTKDPSFNPSSPHAVPERKLFHADVCKYTTKTKEGHVIPESLRGIDTRMVRFLEFMLSPQTFLTHANGEKDRPYVIMMNGKVFLATNQTDVTVWEMAQSEGLQNPYVRYASASESSAVSVEQGDYHVLDKMVMQDNLPVRIMVVEGESTRSKSQQQTTAVGTVFPR